MFQAGGFISRVDIKCGLLNWKTKKCNQLAFNENMLFIKTVPGNSSQN